MVIGRYSKSHFREEEENNFSDYLTERDSSNLSLKFKENISETTFMIYIKKNCEMKRRTHFSPDIVRLCIRQYRAGQAASL